MKKILFLIPLSLLLVWNCGQEVTDRGKPHVTVSILPQEYFVKRIVGDHYSINVMIPPGHSPATYEPTPREMKTVSESILYFRIGHIPFEKAWMDKIASLNKKMKIVDTSRGVPLITGTTPHAHSHEEEAAGEHDHAGIDPHIWLSPSAVRVQAKHILEAFMEVEKDPGKLAAYEENYHAFIQDINQLQKENETLLKPLKGKKFMVYHPVWSYFAREYGLVQFPIELEGKSPGAAAMKNIVDTAKKENIRVIFVQQQFDFSNAQAVANEINGKVITLDPLAPDWLTNMKKIAHTFEESLKNGVVE